MEEQKYGNKVNGYRRAPSATVRDFIGVVFRHRRLITLSFLGIFLAAAVAALVLPDQYEAQMAILVNRDRGNPVVSPAAPVQTDYTPADVTEEELNSEVQLLQSQDLLEAIVRDCHLYRPGLLDVLLAKLIPSLSAEAANQAAQPDPKQVAKAVLKLAKQLDVQVVKRSHVIAVAYETPDPQLSARVLNELEKLYLAKHATVHRPTGTFDFFQQEAHQYRQGLEEAEARLVSFTQQQGVVDGQAEKDLALRQFSQFDVALRTTQVEIADTEHRIRTLEAQTKSTPSRITTQVKRGDNGQLLQQLTSTLLELELRRTELLSKFEPGYRPVQEVEQKIAETRAAIAQAEKSPIKEETTDRDPTQTFLATELAKANADLAGLQARAAATAVAVRAYQQNARWLDEKEVAQQDLIRDVKAAEDNYLLYLRKQEEARISDALDRRQIVNVSIAQAATVPVLPAYPKWLIVLLGGFLAAGGSIGLAFGAEYFDPTFRTPEEVQSSLEIPVLASLPKAGNGNGHAKDNRV
ncbi:MAG: hypothetical protein DMG26_02585 [Acidobacteria bacterium]|nr:MAG: hypothetical protein DMG26_02585 [Acidobacteriota bacterium]